MSNERRAPAGDAAPLHALAACGEAAWDMPLLMASSWWGAMASALRHPFGMSHLYGCKDHQLVVPDPIEDEGEHALFA
jgi:hypothetical protein